jgi:hypothetical protein
MYIMLLLSIVWGIFYRYKISGTGSIPVLRLLTDSNDPSSKIIPVSTDKSQVYKDLLKSGRICAFCLRY